MQRKIEMDIKELKPNENKNLVIETPNGKFERYPVKTKIVMKDDNLADILNECVKPYLQDGDMIFMSEKIVAISQGRAFPLDEIKPSRLAKFLVKFVYKSPYGIGIGSPWTMELAIREVGRVRIVFCAIIAGICKLFRVRGVFYNMLGERVRAIDGPCDYTLPPYNNYAKMAPAKPHDVAKKLTEAMGGNKVIIVDANDIGVNILGKPDKNLDDNMLAAIFKDNPLGQTSEQTPIAIVRPVK
ncbi:MAG: coenzyme F420-0:L-glutamate ligase [Oscillospiraceae bacterium]|nr:coenzyme F420-0:L-glutamate ligase [Oscillospiraceae bacterium]